MNVLRPDEFTVGTLATAKPISLVLPRNTNDQTMLVVGTDAEPFAVFLLSKQYRFQGFTSADAHNWSGVIIPNVTVELDQTSLYDPGYNDVRLGSLIRSEDALSIASKQDGWMGRYQYKPVISGLPKIDDRHSAGFTRWQVTIGQDIDRRVLLTVDADAPKE